MKNLLLTCLLLLQSAALFAVNYTGQERPFKQPDGSKVTLRLYGSEYYMRAESPDSFTLIRDKATNWICYARLSADGKSLVATHLHYTGRRGEAASLHLPRHLDIPLAERQKIIRANQQRTGGVIGAHEPHVQQKGGSVGTATAQRTPILPLSGTIKGLCIVIDFPDEPGALPISEFDDFCNKINYTGFGNNGSLRTFYSDISGGLVDYQNVVFGYYHAPQNFTYYDALPYAVGAQMLLGQALAWIDATGFDFSTLTIESDGHIKAINMMYTGNPPNWAQGMWHHQGEYTGFTADGVTSGRYNCSPANSPLEMGTVCHENGHMIGHWPDTYKYTSTTGPDGIGDFDLMCGVGPDWKNPVPPNPLFLSNVGWMNNVDVTNYNGIRQDTSNSLSCYKYRNVNDTDEFYLLKSATLTGRSAGLPGNGLTIWHIDRNGDNQTTHHEVYLEHAAGAVSGNHAMAGYQPATSAQFTRTTNPAATFYNGDYNALRVWDISVPGTYANYKFGAGAGAAAVKLLHGIIANDNNGNGLAEPGETANITVGTANFGTAGSSALTLTTAAVGAGSTYVTINTPSIPVGIVAAGGSTTVPVSFTVHPGTPLGTVITMRHTVTDDTAVMLQQVVIGDLVPISPANITACNALYVDPGGLNGNYQDSTNITQTITAGTGATALTVSFSEFELEDEPNCAYDYLEIYDGNSTSAPLIGRYCGTASPGTLTSTNAAAALTFRFHADEGVNFPGWKAILSCNAPAGVGSTPATAHLALYPNPASDAVNLYLAESSVVTVTDIMGKATGIARQLPAGPATLDLSMLPGGTYIVRTQGAAGLRIGKVTLIRN